VAAEADFYGAMDGASKFVKGDAIAGIIIILINIIGGIAIGILQRGMEIGEAVSTYTVMTIGDGLVSQIPALLMAVATGMIVTRSNAENDMGSTAAKQLAQSRGSLMIAGFTAVALGFIPGMPILPFLVIGGILIFASWRIKVSEDKAAAAELVTAHTNAAPRAETTEDIIEQMRVHAVEIALSPDLVDLVTGASDDLLARVKALRRKIAMDMGFVVPPVRTGGTAWSYRHPPIRFVSRASRPAAGSRRPARCSPSGTTSTGCRASRRSSRSSGWWASGCRARSAATPKSRGRP
jgi:flagellar biosynthesis protein FlhA